MRTILILIISSSFIVGCLNKNDQNSLKYNFEKHDDINAFIDDLAKAVTNNDRSTVAKMTQFPFLDYWDQIVTTNTYDTSQSIAIGIGLDSRDSTEFLSKYDSVFVPRLVSEIRKKNFRPFHKEEISGDLISEGEFVIYEEEFREPRPYAIAITKFNGVYKLSRLAFNVKPFQKNKN